MLRVGAFMVVGLLCCCRPPDPPVRIVYKAALAELRSAGFPIKTKEKNAYTCLIETGWLRVERGLDRVRAGFVCTGTGLVFGIRRQRWDSAAAKYITVKQRTAEDNQWIQVTIDRISKRAGLKGARFGNRRVR